MDLYREIILDHYKHPHNFGHLERSSATGTLYNSACGDTITMEIIVNKEGKITDVRFSGEGCAISQASASMLTDIVKGKTKDEIMKLTSKDVIALLQTELTVTRMKCALLPLEVLQKTITDTV